MIDIKKELQCFHRIDLGEKNWSKDDSYYLVSEELVKMVERLSKEQYRIANDIGDALDLLEDTDKQEEIILTLTREKEDKKKQQQIWVEKILEMNDVFLETCRFIAQFGEENWKKQVTLQRMRWEEVNKQIGIGIIGDIHEKVNMDNHEVVEVKENLEFNNLSVLEIVKEGYTYNTKVLRKAKVIVNRREL